MIAEGQFQAPGLASLFSLRARRRDFIYVTEDFRRLYFFALARPYRLAVRTPPFHGGGTGSIPVRVAIFQIVYVLRPIHQTRTGVFHSFCLARSFFGWAAGPMTPVHLPRPVSPSLHNPGTGLPLVLFASGMFKNRPELLIFCNAIRVLGTQLPVLLP